MNIVMIAPDCYMIDRRIILEARTLIKSGHSVTLLAGFECSKEEHYFYEGIEIFRYKYDWDDERLKIIRSHLPQNDKIRMFVNKVYMYLARRFFEFTPFDYYMLTKLLETKADIFHVHDLPCLKAGVQAARICGIPLIYDAHELYYAQDVLPRSLQKIYFKQEKKYVRCPNAVITVNPFIARLMSDRYGIDEPEVIMNCTEFFGELDPELARIRLRAKGNIPEHYRVVLYQGWISQERNIETIIRSVKHFSVNACLAIIGYGEHEINLRSLAEKEKVGERVFFLGAVPSDEILYLTTGADIGVIPYLPIDDNHHFCSPNKFFEYILAGIPIITADLPFFRLMKEKYGVPVLTDMGNSEYLGKLVAKLLSEPSLLSDLKLKCNKAGRELNWEVEGKKLLEIYDRLSVCN